MEIILIILGAVLSFLGVKAFNTKSKQKSHDTVKTLEGQKIEINKREEVKEVPELKPDQVVDYWNKELK